MNSDNNKVWISVYLFYPEPWEEFLVHGIYPFIKKGRQRGIIHQFFFIRYWENGAHIRLRIKCRADDKASLEHDIKEYFYRYAQTVPSMNADVSPVRNFHIEFVDYKPEIERYGGTATISLAENQFELSSDTVLSFIASKPDWNYQRMLGCAIQLHLSFAFACKMDINTAIDFFSYIRRAANYNDATYKDEISRAFENSFREQKSFLIPRCNRLWNALKERRPFEEPWMNTWIAGSENIHDLYKKSERQVVVRRAYSNHPMFDIYGSLVHMNNNRIGILNRDEAYLAHILANSLTG